jgi:DNA repair protein RAD16
MFRNYLESYIADAASAECPVCFTKLSINTDQPQLELPTFEMANQDKSRCNIVSRMMHQMGSSSSGSLSWNSSTKIEALLEELTLLRQQDQTIKSIVFSQFVSFLDLVRMFCCGEWRVLMIRLASSKGGVLLRETGWTHVAPAT